MMALTRTNKACGCVSRSMVSKFYQAAEQKWRRLNGNQLLADVVKGIKFKDGIKVDRITA